MLDQEKLYQPSNNIDFSYALSNDANGSASDLLAHLTHKFNRLLEALRAEEDQRKKLEVLTHDL